MQKRPISLPLLLLFLFALTFPLLVSAQDEEPTEVAIPKIHVVESGESLTYIAGLYDTSVEAMLFINDLANGDFLFVGQELLIPGIEGDEVLTFYTAIIGDTLAGIAAQFNTTVEEIVAANNLVSPNIAAGQPLTVISKTGNQEPLQLLGRPIVVQAGNGLYLTAFKENMVAAQLAQEAALTFPKPLITGQRLVLDSTQVYRPLSDSWETIKFTPPIQAGQTAVLFVKDVEGVAVNGRFLDQDLIFHPYEDGYLAYIGISPLVEEAYYPLELSGSSTFRQAIKVSNEGIITGEVTLPETLAPLLVPEVRENEDEILDTIYTIFNPDKYWEDTFQSPVINSLVSSNFGVLRSYNGGPYNVIHTGVDFAPPLNTPITTPNNGIVTFSAPLDLRGNVIIIDHGLGVMSGYYHLSEATVSVGQPVVKGQEIGIVGTTGLSTGIHLHWDMRVNGVPINPTQWLEQVFP